MSDKHVDRALDAAMDCTSYKMAHSQGGMSMSAKVTFDAGLMREILQALADAVREDCAEVCDVVREHWSVVMMDRQFAGATSDADMATARFQAARTCATKIRARTADDASSAPD